MPEWYFKKEIVYVHSHCKSFGKTIAERVANKN
jgi:hypothetical protein